MLQNAIVLALKQLYRLGPKGHLESSGLPWFLFIEICLPKIMNEPIFTLTVACSLQEILGAICSQRAGLFHLKYYQ